jgi:hypothetical protein
MRKLPVLKPQEVVSRLEALGFVEVRQAAVRQAAIEAVAAGPLCRSTRGGTSRRYCSGRLRATLECPRRILWRRLDSGRTSRCSRRGRHHGF